jgi:hypothetical protein
VGRLEQGPTRGRLERIELVVGVISAVIGLATAIFGLPGDLETALGRGDLEKTELEQKRIELRAVAPRLNVSYLFLSGDLALAVLDGTPRRTKPPTSKEAISLLSYPTISNEILNMPVRSADGCKIGHTTTSSVVFLVIENRGKRDATEITVNADQVQLAAPVRVDQALGGGNDYVVELRGAARSTTSVTFTIPRPLAPSGGVRVPLWTSATPQDRSNPWCIVSPAALIPTSVAFVDPVLDASTTMNVRRIISPQSELDHGIEAGVPNDPPPPP